MPTVHVQRRIDGKLWFCTNHTKEVYQDMQRNPYIEITTSSPEYAWLRLSGEATFENNMEAKEMCMRNPIVKGQYGGADNPIFEVFYLKTRMRFWLTFQVIRQRSIRSKASGHGT